MQVDAYRVPRWVSVLFRVTNADIQMKRDNMTTELAILNGERRASFQAEFSQNLLVELLGPDHELTEGLLAKTDYEPYRSVELDMVIQRIIRDYIRRMCKPITYMNVALSVQILDVQFIRDPYAD